MREHVNTKTLELSLEKMKYHLDKARIREQQEELTKKVDTLEAALLMKLSTEDPCPTLGKGSLARRHLKLPASRVLVTGSAGVLAGLIYGKLQRATGTGAANPVGLKLAKPRPYSAGQRPPLGKNIGCRLGVPPYRHIRRSSQNLTCSHRHRRPDALEGEERPAPSSVEL